MTIEEKTHLIREITNMNERLSLERIEHLLGEIQNELTELLRSHGRLATKEDLRQLETKIMGTYADALAAFQAGMDGLKTDQAEFTSDLADVATSINNITTTVADLKKQIDELNSGTGTVTSSDQPAIDKLQAAITDADSQAKATNAATKALVVPSVPTPPPVTS